MKFKETNVGTQKEILKVKTGGEYLAPITLDVTAFVNGVCKAGNPIDAAGKKVNAASGDAVAVGILINDAFDSNPNSTLLKGFGVVNTVNANANAGITIAEGVKTQLPNIMFA